MFGYLDKIEGMPVLDDPNTYIRLTENGVRGRVSTRAPCTWVDIGLGACLLPSGLFLCLSNLIVSK